MNWSSSSYVGYSSYAWFVDFYNGVVYSYSRNLSIHVRLVRAGQ